MGFDDQPDEEAPREVERANCAGSYMDLKSGAGFYAEGDHGATSFDGFDCAGKNIAGAEEVRSFGGDEDVACTNSDPDFAIRFGVAERNFDFTGGMIERDAHDAVGGTVFHHNRGENIFKAS